MKEKHTVKLCRAKQKFDAETTWRDEKIKTLERELSLCSHSLAKVNLKLCPVQHKRNQEVWGVYSQYTFPPVLICLLSGQKAFFSPVALVFLSTDLMPKVTSHHEPCKTVAVLKVHSLYKEMLIQFQCLIPVLTSLTQ